MYVACVLKLNASSLALFSALYCCNMQQKWATYWPCHNAYRYNVSHTHMHTDSPAARTSLKCGDELLAVNGLSLQDTTHSEATNILQEVSKQS